MVPFIDVMLVLLIIFMVTAPLIAPSMIDLPSVGKAPARPDQVLEFVIGKDEALELKVKSKDPATPDKQTALDLKDVAATVKRAQGSEPNTAFVISADRSVKYETVVKLMDKLQQAGAKRIGLSVQLAGPN